MHAYDMGLSTTSGASSSHRSSGASLPSSSLEPAE
jgi:hypothetical protein